MYYSCQEEYESAMSGQAEAEAENDYQYNLYLEKLSKEDPYLFALEIAYDLFSSKEFERSGLSFLEYVSKIKMERLKPKETNNDKPIEGLPF